MKITISLLLALGIAQFGLSQNQINFPTSLEGTEFNLSIQSGQTEFYAGIETETFGINQNYLGPILFVNKGDSIELNVTNMLSEMSTMHWHGLHIPANKDGGPHQEIAMGELWSPKFKILDNAGTYWFHPHPHGATLKQVTMGAAGIMIIRDEAEAALALPRTYGVDDFPVILQTVDFTDEKQIDWISMELNTPIVNGTVDGYMELPAQVVRLRLLNASNHMGYAFGLSNGSSFQVIGNDDGLLGFPVEKTQLIINAGERYEILVDLSGMEGEEFNVMSYGSDIPTGWPGSSDAMGMAMSPLDDLDYTLFSVHVIDATPNAINSIPTVLIPNAPYSSTGLPTRTFTLTGDGMMITTFAINGQGFNMDVINETVQLGSTELWVVNNQSMIGHPFHIHGNSFFVKQRNGATPPAEILGRKDVVLVPPQQGSVKLAIKFEDFADDMMPYMYHCHILDHEDGGMMGQYIVSENPNSISETQINEISIYPNPTTKYLNFTLATPQLEPSTVQILNAQGQIVDEAFGIDVSNQVSIDIEFLSIGNYYLRVLNSNFTTSIPFIKI